ncbi:hypothetical protein ACET3Z_021368 [Daucus carota]
MESRTAKRKRCNEIRDNVVDETHALVLNSANLVNEIQTANEDFAKYYKTMSEKHSELISQAMGINEQYRYLDDIYTSVQGHSKKYNEACDQMIKDLENNSESLKAKLRDLKEQGDEIQNQKVQLRVQFHDFKKNVNP